MQVLDSAISIDHFMARLEHSRQGVLILDFDGTLAPFETDRLAVKVYPEASACLRAILEETPTRVIIVSGRSAHEVRGLIALNRIEIWGAHGMEHLTTDGIYEAIALPRQTAVAFEYVMDELERQGMQQHAEMKVGSVAIHWRGLSDSARQELRAATMRLLAPISTGIGLMLIEFDGGLELRVHEPNKGTVVRAIRNELPADCPISYLGDDLTDEDAFKALKGEGLSLLVRPEYRSTSADAWLRPPEELATFLDHWLRVCGGAA